MNWMALLTTLVQLVPYIPQVITAWNQPTSSMQKLQAIAADTPVEKELEAIGAVLFPKLAPEFHAAAALLQIAHPTALQYVQGGLNILAAAKVFTMPPTVKNGMLAVDGVWGGQTTAAAEAAEAAAKIPLSGAINDMLVNWIGGKLAAMG